MRRGAKTGGREGTYFLSNPREVRSHVVREVGIGDGGPGGLDHILRELFANIVGAGGEVREALSKRVQCPLKKVFISPSL